MRYTGSLHTIQRLDALLKQLTIQNPPRAEITHDGEALVNAVWGYNDCRPLVYTRKYSIYLKSGIRDLVPKSSLTLRFDIRSNRGHVCISRTDLPILKPHLSRLIPQFTPILDSLTEVHELTDIQKPSTTERNYAHVTARP